MSIEGFNRIISVGFALFAFSHAAMAQPGCPPSTAESYRGEMRFTVQERPGQRPVLIAEGTIDQNVVPRLQAALETFRGLEIWLRSPGGWVGVDREAGRLIRARGLVTRIPSGWTCRGACNFMFLGGIVREVDEGGRFVVSMFANTGDLSNFVEVGGASRRVATEDYDYLLRMGVSPRLLSEVMYRLPAEEGRCLTRAELNNYVVTNLGR